MGYGDDWQKALEHVKDLHVEPGGNRAHPTAGVEAIDFVKKTTWSPYPHGQGNLANGDDDPERN